jgi:hypothetical protein
MHSKRAPVAEAVLRTVTELERSYGAESPQILEEIRRKVLLRLSDRLNSSKSKGRVLIVRDVPPSK